MSKAKTSVSDQATVARKLAAGEDCRGTRDCADGLYCKSGGCKEGSTCEPKLGPGGHCFEGDECAAGLHCDLEKQVCQRKRSSSSSGPPGSPP
jgi:hypothetical protein